MPSKLKMPTFLKRAARVSKDYSPATEVVEDACRSDLTLDIDVVDMGLFVKDPDTWFAKAMFQYYLAMAIQNEHLGHVVVNPRDVIEQIEAKYWRVPCPDAGGSIGPQYPGAELLGRIKAARATKDNTTLQVFLGELSSEIVLSCRRLRNEKVVELDASQSVDSDRIHRATTPSTATSSIHSECNREATPPETEREAETTADNVQQQSTSIQSNPSQFFEFRGTQPTHRSTSILYEHAARTNGELTFQEYWMDTGTWRYVGELDGISGTGEAQSKKEAKHIASRAICQALGIL